MNRIETLRIFFDIIFTFIIKDRDLETHCKLEYIQHFHMQNDNNTNNSNTDNDKQSNEKRKKEKT